MLYNDIISEVCPTPVILNDKIARYRSICSVLVKSVFQQRKEIQICEFECRKSNLKKEIEDNPVD